MPLRVRLIDLRGALAQLQIEPRHPAGEMLVFANACRSAVMEGSGESLVSFLMEKQYEQLIGGEGLLPDRVAGEFAVRSYRRNLAVAARTRDGPFAIWFADLRPRQTRLNAAKRTGAARGGR